MKKFLKSFFIVVSSLLVITTVTSCTNEKDISKKQGKPLLYVELSSPYSPSYFISLDDNKKYNIEKGNGEKGETLENYINGTLKNTESQTVEIASEKYDELVSLISKLNSSKENKDSLTFWEAWNVTISIDNSEEYFVYGDAPNEYYDLIVENLIELSPMKIVDSNGQSISKVQEIQENQAIDFYYQNKNQLNKIKDALYDCEYSIREIREDGHILLADNSTVWLKNVSPSIKQIFDDGTEYNIRAMYFGERVENTAFWVESFFDENDLEIDIVYSETDLTVNNMYSNIEGNWYLFVAGMT